jgi:hypothetical protein
MLSRNNRGAGKQGNLKEFKEPELEEDEQDEAGEITDRPQSKKRKLKNTRRSLDL